MGSGTGLVGIGLAFLGAKYVLMTDLEGVVSLIEKNVAANPAIASRTVVAMLSLGTYVKLFRCQGGRAELVHFRYVFISLHCQGREQVVCKVQRLPPARYHC